MKKNLATIALIASAVMNTQAQETFVKEVVFPAGATPEQKIEMASRVVPSPQQLEWQKLGLTAFLHFGINTFTDREWGDGKEDPNLFNPSDLNTDQWVRTLKEAGFKLVILTAKHHDGFCLWPTKTTPHSVANTKWRGGKGDVMADLRKSCDKYGIKLGVYLSPWDRNAECYGDSPKYNDMFVAQLTELLTNYGKIDEVWFDGACGEGPNGKKQVYDWPRFREVITKLQPEAVLAISGDDVRWVGNESGLGRETEWSVTALSPTIYAHSAESNKRLGIGEMSKNIGSREILAKADRAYWWPAEVDVSIRPGWFYHEKQLPKSLRELAEIYLNSVGRNAVLLLNIPPDTKGRIAEPDVKRLNELRLWIEKSFAQNYAQKREGNRVELNQSKPINAVLVREDVRKGQHVEKFDIEVKKGKNWTKVAEGTTIGNKRILRFPDVIADSLRVNIKESRGKNYLSSIEAYNITMPEAENIDLPAYRKLDSKEFKLTKADGKIADASKLFDGDNKTFWQSKNSKGSKSLTLNLGKEANVAGFVYTPREGDDKSGTIYHYTFETSLDGKNWTKAELPGEFSNIVNNPIAQRVYLKNPLKARFIRFSALDEIEGRNFVTIGEFSIITPQ